MQQQLSYPAACKTPVRVAWFLQPCGHRACVAWVWWASAVIGAPRPLGNGLRTAGSASIHAAQ